MVFKTTSTENKAGAWTLVEMMVAMTLVAAVFATAMISFTIYSSQTLAALYNYTELDSKSQNSLDNITREIRQMTSLRNTGTTTLNGQTITNMLRIVVTNSTGARYWMTWTYSPIAKTLTQEKNMGSTYLTSSNVSTRVLLKDCTYFNFSLYQRNTLSNSFDQFPYAASTTTLKLVQLNWTCRRQVVRSIYNTESVQSMKAVVRLR